MWSDVTYAVNVRNKIQTHARLIYVHCNTRVNTLGWNYIFHISQHVIK